MKKKLFLSIFFASFLIAIKSVNAYDSCNFNAPIVPCSNGLYDYDTYLEGNISSFHHQSFYSSQAFAWNGSSSNVYIGIGSSYSNNQGQSGLLMENGNLYNGTGYFTGASFGNITNDAFRWFGGGAHIVDTGGIIVGGSVPQLGLLANTCSYNFSSIPSIISDPLGFVQGVWSTVSNWFVCLYSSSIDVISGLLIYLFVPDFSPIANSFQSTVTIVQEKFPFFSQLVDAVYITYTDTTPDNTAIWSGDIVVGGESHTFSYNPLHSFTIPEFVPTIITSLIYLSALFFLIRKADTIFKLGD